MESARHSFGHTRLQSPAFTKFADLSNVSFYGGVEIFKLACLVGKANVVGINEFPSRCCTFTNALTCYLVRGSSVVGCRTRNRESPGSNHSFATV